MKRIHLSTALLFALLFGVTITLGCTSNTEEVPESEEETANESGVVADIVSVEVNASFVFSVGIESPDTGCDQYANWWEVITPEGTLLYRRILAHSHITEQPFVRSGGPIDMDENAEVYIRAHMHPTGYGGTAFRGTMSTGFSAFSLDADFADNLAEEEPLPTGCTG